MPGLQSNCGRVDLSELKSRLEKLIGLEKAARYYSCLKGFLSFKIQKPAFEKLCSSILGPDAMPLHNLLIVSIVRNACLAKGPPLLVCKKLAVKPAGVAKGKSLAGEDGLEPSQPKKYSAVWSNGCILPQKSRSGTRERRTSDRHPMFGLNGITEVSPHCHSATVEPALRVNGCLSRSHLRRPLQLQTDDGEPSSKRQCVKKPLRDEEIADRNGSLCYWVDAVDVEVVESVLDLRAKLGPLRAPLGIPFCPASVGGASRNPRLSIGGSCSSFSTNRGSRELCSAKALRERMEKIAQAQGLEGVTLECAELLNRGLDAYLKRLIKPSLELSVARSIDTQSGPHTLKLQPNGKVINGFLLPDQMLHGTRGNGSEHSLVTLTDFKVAMELNPQLLGENSAVLLSKIEFSSFER